MSTVLAEADMDALAAEFVLGTLGSEERAQAQALLGIDKGFSDRVRFWERRFGELHLMVDPVDPDPQVWTRIKDKFAGTAQNPPLPTTDLVPREDAQELFAEKMAPVAASAADVAASPADAAANPADAAANPADAAETADPANVPAPALAPADASAAAATSEPEPAPSLPPTTLSADLTTALENELAAAIAAAAPTSASSAPVSGPAATPPGPKPAPITTAAAPFPSAPRAPLVTGDRAAVVPRGRLRRWQAFSLLLLLLLLALGGLVAAWRFAPEHVPPLLQPIEALRAVGIVIETGPAPQPPRPPAPPESQFDE